MQDSESVTFAGGTLDRAAHLRGDDGLLNQSDARALPLWHGKPLVDVSGVPRLAWLPMDAEILKVAEEAPIFLGLQAGAPRFAYDVSSWLDENADKDEMGKFRDESRNQHPGLPDTLKFIDLRSIMADLTHDDAGDAATAKGIFAWHLNHRYCANCGAPTVVSQSGWQRLCPACAQITEEKLKSLPSVITPWAIHRYWDPKFSNTKMLKQDLEKAVLAEDFEKAILIRDVLNDIKEPAKS